MQGRHTTFTMMVIVFFTFSHADLRADLAEFLPVQDTTLYEDSNGRFGNGSGQYLFVGRTWDENGIDALLRRALVKFDLSSVPRGSIISSASFSFTIDQVPPAATGAIVSLHKVTGGWGEGASNAPGAEGRGTTAQVNDATWLHRFFDTLEWSTPGGDFAGEAIAGEPISSSPQTVTFTSNPQLLAAVQDWVDNPASNHGWILLGDEVFPQNARRILSREHNGPGNPLLSIAFTPAPAKAVPAFSGAGLAVLILFLLLLSRFFLLRRPKRAGAAQH